MSETEKMWAYIERTKIPNFDRQKMTQKQLDELVQLLAEEFPRGILYTVFCYGLARGYRLAKKEAAQ